LATLHLHKDCLFNAPEEQFQFLYFFNIDSLIFLIDFCFHAQIGKLVKLFPFFANRLSLKKVVKYARCFQPVKLCLLYFLNFANNLISAFVQDVGNLSQHLDDHFHNDLQDYLVGRLKLP